MPSETLTASTTRRQTGSTNNPGWPGAWPVRALDATILILFLGTAFLLGLFPLKDTDFWWHLRTGDLIRQTGKVPQTDWYTFTVPNNPWVDLHWGFQVAISWVFERGGIPALNLAKSAVTCLALFLLVTSRRKDWPVWAVVLAWIPALLVLSGRMYVRPETLSLLCLAAQFAVVFRWQSRPWLAYLLPLIQVVWVNVQGIFVLGLFLVGMAVVDAALSPGAFSAERRGWWKKVLPACVLTGLACLVNPYGLRGALYPLELAATMSNPIFSRTILELQSIPDFIESAGLNNLPLQLHLGTMVLGAISFIVPLLWLGFVRLAGKAESPAVVKAVPSQPAKRGSKEPARTRKSKAKAKPAPVSWRLSPFRLVLFVAFSAFSLKATRNSHQFAAVVGTITAWNFAEWVAAIRRHREAGGQTSLPLRTLVVPRALTAVVLVGLGTAVVSGSLYAWAGEGRTIGLGEEPLWFPRGAVEFAGRPGMPDRMVGFHNGHPALYTYYHGPDRKIFADARLEVIGPEMYQRYLDLQQRMTEDKGNWQAELAAMERPVILIDNLNAHFADSSATLLGSNAWRCVYFDPVACLFLHESDLARAQVMPIDFGARHFHPSPDDQPRGIPSLIASSKALRNLAIALQKKGRFDLARSVVLLGLDHARQVRDLAPGLPDGWKAIALLDSIREPMIDQTSVVPRYRLPLDVVFDLASLRTTYDLQATIRRTPDDFLPLFTLLAEYSRRGMWEEVLPLTDRLLALPTINRYQRATLVGIASQRNELSSRLTTPPSWENRGDLEQTVEQYLAQGRAGSAARLLSTAFREGSRPWDVADRLATLQLHLGDPAQARETLLTAVNVPSKALRDARVGLTFLIESDFEAARGAYRSAVAADPALFEAHYGLAVLEQDAGRAREALDAARQAVATAPSEVARTSAQSIAAYVSRYVSPSP